MMKRMMNLIHNENIKIASRTSTWVMIGLLIFMVMGVGIVTKFLLPSEEITDWRAVVSAENDHLTQIINDPVISEGERQALQETIAINEYRLTNDLPPVSDQSILGFTLSSSMLISIITLFTIIFAATSVAAEFSSGTIKLLLIRPVHRLKILFSKYISAFCFSIVFLAVLLIASLLVGALFFGFENVNAVNLSYEQGMITETPMLLHILFIYVLNSVELLMMVTFAFMIASVFRNQSLAIGLSIFLMFTGSQLVFALSQYDWVKYILFANTHLQQFFTGQPLIEGLTLGFSLMMLLIYFIIFHAIASYMFVKRDVGA
ncbi:ABC transporter permease [Alkalihalobacterium chitinilyticum]|uniref:ABC transporter permease n=1 Tax=Alkalihalobacterium chitinilyticum TaxID=2980103 RepID=A0ABT5VJS0_9BACI|nr:ABC transporter permease subunit [Alkalihalobacterium chitinilyticum]MDE5415703.1 ABC transporter permease [Alkalihalobacterium chitinilyticum]